MEEDRRRELYGAADVGARQVPDVWGPDGVRVTLVVEPAVDQLRRWRRRLFVPPMLALRATTSVEYGLLPALVQRHLLGDRWVVDIEADSGECCRVRADSRSRAVEYARTIRAGIETDGVAYLRTFAR